jgi:hypothetical protein
MRLTFRLLGITVFSIDVEAPDAEEAEEYEGDTRLTTSDHTIAFGFNPLNIDEYWEEEDRADIQASP